MSRPAVKGKIQNIPYSGNLVALIPAIIAIISLAGLLLLLQTGRLITSSYDIRHLEQERARWQARNQLLEAEVSALKSLDRIEQVAKEKLGMVPAKQQFYVTLTPLETAEAAAQPEQPLQAGTDPFSDWWGDFLTLIGFQERAVNP